MDLWQRAQQCLLTQRAFVLFRKPDAQVLEAWFQKTDPVIDWSNLAQPGFIVAPFDGDAMLFPQKDFEVFRQPFTPQSEIDLIGLPLNDQAGKADFEPLVAKAVTAIKADAFDKVVLSRPETTTHSETDFTKTYQRLVAAYPSAFAYCCYHPNFGLWMGATPERLLRVQEGKLQTMALAGTQVYKETTLVNWPLKEQQEQQFVTDFISAELLPIARDLSISAPYTHRAGNLLHIRTDIAATLQDAHALQAAVEVLHPTPAVCGLPKAAARDFILAHEGYDRDLYAGYLGTWHTDGAGEVAGTDLFVNLRCMRWRANEVKLYVGCGITQDSDPLEEYLETVQKTMTLKKILQ